MTAGGLVDFRRYRRSPAAATSAGAAGPGPAHPCTAPGLRQKWPKSSLEEVTLALAPFPNTVLLPGWIPERFAEVRDKTFCFVHIDVDLYQPTKDSIAFFYPRMQPGGIILCDDYGFTTCPGATKAVDEYLGGKLEKMISLCSGGGFMIKGCMTQG